METIGDIITPREEVITGKFQGALQAHKAEIESESLESKPTLFFQSTYPSNRIKQILAHINQKTRKISQQGACVLTGPYGAGKSHGLILLYHLFKNPVLGMEWTNRWNIELELPKESDAVIISTLKEDPDLLWVPILKRAGREDLLDRVERFASIDIIQELVSNRTFAIVLDEIESWYVSMEKTNPDLLERNRSFLQCLLEVAGDPDYQLFVFVSTLGKGTTLEEILSRTSPPREDMSTTDDRERILLHRLFETPRDEIDSEQIGRIIDEYEEAYENHLPNDDLHSLKQRMIRYYPFHPFLLDLLDNLYESSASQNVRGQIMVLAEAISKCYNKTNLITISDLNELAFRGMNLELVSRFDLDSTKRLKNDELGINLLRVVLLYSLCDVIGGASELQVLLGSYKTKNVVTITDLAIRLEKLVGKAVYIHHERGRWLIKGEENVIALVEREARAITDKESEYIIKEITISDVFGNAVNLYEMEREIIPDDKQVRYIVLGRNYGDTTKLAEELNTYLADRRWGNTLIFITPVKEGPLQSRLLIDKAKRIVAGQNLRERVEDSSDRLDKIIKEERRQVRSDIEGRYGHLVTWATRGNGELDVILKKVHADFSEIKEKSVTDESHLEDWLLRIINKKERGVKVEWLVRNLKQVRGSPVLTDDNILFLLISRLLRQNEIAVQGDRGRYLVPSEVHEIEDEYVILDYEFIPEGRVESEMEPSHDEAPRHIQTGLMRDYVEKVPGSIESTGKTSRISSSFEGKTPSVVVSKMESSLNEESDLIVAITIRPNQRFSKDEILEIIEAIPRRSSFEVVIEIDRIED